MVNRDAFDKGTMLDNGGASGQAEDFVRTFGHVCEIEFIIAGPLEYVVWRVEEDASANGWTVVAFPKALIEVGIVMALGLLERC